jgi:hypothetical protein
VSRLDRATDVRELAVRLGLAGAANPVEAILGYCRNRIDRWLSEVRGVTTIGQLEALVTQRLQMVIEEIRSDADFKRITENYARGKRDPVFAALRLNFDDAENPKFGVLVRRNVAADAPDRFVAVIDCRGSKLARRFFTRWHEIAHRLTTHADQGDSEPAYRSVHDPIERLMDEIAGHVGFYGPFFEPVFEEQLRGKMLLTFEVAEAVRRLRFAEASFQATLRACCRRTPSPVIYVEAALAHKVEDQREINRGQGRLFEDDQPVAKLRAVEVVPNPAAQQAGFFIAPRMRVPEESVIHRLYSDDEGRSLDGEENLHTWEHSGGERLADQRVCIEARKVKERVIAIMQPFDDGQ